MNQLVIGKGKRVWMLFISVGIKELQSGVHESFTE